MGDLLAAKNGLLNNIPGTTINGTALRPPVAPFKNHRRSQVEKRDGSPDLQELDLIIKSFKPG